MTGRSGGRPQGAGPRPGGRGPGLEARPEDQTSRQEAKVRRAPGDESNLILSTTLKGLDPPRVLKLVCIIIKFP